MQRAGGYSDYRALLEDARDYHDVEIWLAAEGDAAHQLALEAKRGE